jgi:hypothetical protein
MSKCGLAMLFDRAGGSLTASMRDVIANDEVKKPHAQAIIAEIRSYFFARSSSRIAGIKPLRNAISKTPSASFVPGYCCIAHLMYIII